MKILRIAVSTPLRQHFDYLPPEGSDHETFSPGMRVRVPFGKREVIGIVVGFAEEPSIPIDKLKRIKEILDPAPIISEDIMQLCVWAADYYHHSLGDIFSTALPVLLRKGKKMPMTVVDDHRICIAKNEKELNEEQALAVNAIQSALNTFQVFLLEGVTGSGKTEVYLQVISKVLKQKKQVLVIVPEIGLTPQTIQRFRDRFDGVVIALHSGLTNKERLQAWAAAKTGEANIIIGTRSAIFTPFFKLGLIVVDEEHDASFKQQDGFRYHARDLAIMRGRILTIPVILGSATPSLETLQNALQGRYHHLRLLHRAGQATLPETQMIDIRHLPLQEGLSSILLTEIKNHLEKNQQVMLFLNRRGFAPVLMCHGCGWMAVCKKCDTRMTYHQNPHGLHCHHCGAFRSMISTCESCQQKELFMVGLGTERLEKTLEKCFSNYSIARMDRDNIKGKNAIDTLLEEIHAGKHQILIGTQMLAKGHHFPEVTLVAIIDADGGFFSADFRALERMGQLLLQVSGRAGRVEKKGTVMIQTHHPDHPLLHQLLHEGYFPFATALLEERKKANLPPYAYFAILRAEAKKAESALQFLQNIKSVAGSSREVKLLGPVSSFMPKRAGRHRMQLLIQSAKRSALQHFLKSFVPEIEKIKNTKSVRWSLDVDPVEMG